MVYVRFQDFVGSITVEYPVPEDILDDVLPDPDNLADIELHIIAGPASID